METTTEAVPTVQLNVGLPPDLHRRLKITAAVTGWTIKECVIVAVTEFLDDRPASETA